MANSYSPQQITPAGELAIRLPALTPREREALRHMLNADGPKQAARRMGVTVGTSSKLRSRIFDKLNVENAEQAIIRLAGADGGLAAETRLSAEEKSRIEALAGDGELTENERFLLEVVQRLTYRPATLEIADQPELTPRENDVLRLLVVGKSNTVVGKSLGISARTVEQHRASILAKLGAKNTADLTRLVLGRMNTARGTRQ